MLKNAEKTWQHIFDNEVSHLKGKGAAEVLHGMLKNQSQNDKKSYVLKTSEVGQMVEGCEEKKSAIHSLSRVIAKSQNSVHNDKLR